MEFLVLDVGGSAIKYAVMNEGAEFLEKGKVPTPMEGIDAFVDAIGGIYDEFKERISGIAVSMPGRIDSDRGYAYTGGALKYNYDKEIASILQKRCPVPISIENDGKCAALAEVWMGNLKDCDDAIVVVIGTGIGGGIIKDKKLHKGKHFTAGEFSFIFTNNSPIEDKRFKHWGSQGGTFGLRVPVATAKNLPVEEVDGVKVFEYANNGDKEVLDILDDYCYRFVQELFNLQYIYDPEKIAIGGGISEQDILMEYIQRNVEKYASTLPFKLVEPEVVRCKFLNDSNLIGALYNYLTRNGSL
jgi:predicted NBD/HSP70 family sugar kinase